jgi:hypothetical protein
MSESRFNAIVILDAVPEGELNTARRLKEDLRDIAAYVADGLQVRYFRLNSIDDLRAGLLSILGEIQNNGLKPWLHLDGHGLENQSGFVFATKTTSCSWAKLKELIIPMNVELNLNLMLILATCYGGSFARAIETTDKAPVLGLIGPSREVSAGEIESSFTAFYKTFFETLSLGQALAALDQETSSGLYYRTTAEKFFYEVWSLYKTELCTKKALDERARKLYRRLKKENPASHPSVGQIKRTLQSREPEVFDKFRNTYFMYDMAVENRNRFPVTYGQAEKNANEFANQRVNLTA